MVASTDFSPERDFIDRKLSSIGSELTDEDDTVIDLISNSGCTGWGFDGYSDLKVWQNDTEDSEDVEDFGFSVDLSLSGQPNDDTSILGTSMKVRIQGEFLKEDDEYSDINYEVLEANFNSFDDCDDYEGAMYVQKILFGSPGTGKSYDVIDIAKNSLKIEFQETSKILSNTVKTVFHPEYTYSDFMGKLLPLTNGGNVIYKYYPGHFLKALGIAYKNLLQNPDNSNCLLVIDELNRGNASAIFGSAFQLLDRDDDGWSTYELDISDMELVALLNEMDFSAKVNNDFSLQVEGNRFDLFIEKLINKYSSDEDKNDEITLIKLLEQRKIKIPPNLSIIATINTSDESIYYLDSAFKRRWDWQHYPAPNYKNEFSVPDAIKEAKLILSDNSKKDWYKYILGVNEFIKIYHQDLRKIEDKLIGWWFIKPINGQVKLQQVRDKLMFYLWDSVFARNKQLLIKYIEDKLGKKGGDIITFSDFLLCTEDLLEQWVSVLDVILFEKNEINF